MVKLLSTGSKLELPIIIIIFIAITTQAYSARQPKQLQCSLVYHVPSYNGIKFSLLTDRHRNPSRTITTTTVAAAAAAATTTTATMTTAATIMMTAIRITNSKFCLTGHVKLHISKVNFWELFEQDFIHPGKQACRPGKW